jgi:hypothetical protein
MTQMGMSQYCQSIKELSIERLIEQFCQLESNAEAIRGMLTQKVAGCRMALDEQYQQLFKDFLPVIREEKDVSMQAITRTYSAEAAKDR